MSDYRRLPVTIVIVDSGPLISLAACHRLDLLGEFKRRVRVTDVVRAECLRYPDKIGAAELASWFQQVDGQKHKVIDTPLLDDWLDAVAQEEAGNTSRPSKGIGDASIAWLIQQINNSEPRDELILLLSDDANFGDVVVRGSHPEVYMLSTRLFLQVLENFGRLQSAQSLYQEIVEAGRNLGRYAVDRPGRVQRGVKSQWTDVLQDDDENGNDVS
ncbi:hypothetical protein EJ070_25015 [Mesorhizobium sp. M1E.F.Ca.ET.045.02.1.1]|uniref:hypothetical protein n=1 Tax=unclassified Mesorhizobium TaxID=325217 RepID=UPI000F7553B3|nr:MULTISPECIES: hypothetical protein [unclassified Mesorhizobium]AZO23612.1 hypothetical protein EJ070_25015 [Mesorhizobium sp. M1E.F.Ca.ET.045.02.1.1]RUW35209.1 hypothetical protein EOA38_08795 [Mesorhizobium sp. M1E.F.Ca.ET.041.01.1.1]